MRCVIAVMVASHVEQRVEFYISTTDMTLSSPLRLIASTSSTYALKDITGLDIAALFLSYHYVLVLNIELLLLINAN